jgi:L-asparaginase
MKITFLTCWWTFDKDYATSKWSYDFIISEPKIKDILAKLRLNIEINIISVLKKDSLDMDDNDRQKVFEAVKNADSENIIIIHWTDTMIDTWKIIKQATDKTIILVGSSLPYIFRNSDADFNIWFAVWSINLLNQISKKWVFLAMNWELFDIDNVIKTQEWIFKKIN